MFSAPYPLDGELFLGRGEFQRCMSIVRKSVPTDDWKYIKYLVFDAPKHESDDVRTQAVSPQLDSQKDF